MRMFSAFAILLAMTHVTCALNSPANVVETVPDVTLISGKPANLTCKYNRTVFAVHWRYQSNSNASTERLVTLDEFYNLGERSGPGYDEGRFYITDDYSLTIDKVQPQDEGKYLCEVSDFETGSLLRNHTNVTTVATAELPFVRIAQCEYEVPSESAGEHCALDITSDVSSIDLTCSVVGAKPEVVLTWESSMSFDDWKQGKNESRERTNGVFDQTLTVNVDISRNKLDKRFICFAKGSAVRGVANATIDVHYKGDMAERRNWTVPAIVISLTVCVLLFSLVAVCVCWIWRKGFLRQKAMVWELRHRKADRRVYLGVLGDKNAGKSSFIDSIKILTQVPTGIDSAVDNSTSEMWEDTSIIYEGLRIRKQRDEKEITMADDISSLLSPKRKNNSTSKEGCEITDDSDLIHYPICIFDIRNRANWEERLESLRKVSGAVHRRILQYPMIVLTKASASKDQSEEDSMEELIGSTGIPRENILVTFQFLSKSVDGDEHTRFEQLEFIMKCIGKVDSQRTSIKKRLVRHAKVPGEKESYDKVSSMNTDV